MANVTTFAEDYFGQVRKLVEALEILRVLNDRIAQDSNLVSDYFASTGHRTDIDSTAFADAKAAVVQIMFTFDSGSPAQKAALFKLL